MENTHKRVLVTGASGFIGGHACTALSRTGALVRAMVRKTSDVRHLDPTAVEICYGDLSDEQSLLDACKDIDVIVHTAAVVGSFGEWAHFHETGVMGTKRLLDAAQTQGVSRFVHLSSIAVYGLKHHGRAIDESTTFDQLPQPWNHYVREKVMTEEILWRAHAEGRIQATAVRPSVVIGSRDRNAMPRMVDLLKFPIIAMPGSPHNRFPVVCIKDCIEAILRVIDNDLTIGRAYNVSGKKSITISELFGLVAKHGNLKAPSIFLPPSVLYFPVGLLEGAWRLLQRPAEPLVTRIAIAIVGYDYEIVCDRAYRELDWVPEDDYASAVIAALTPP